MGGRKVMNATKKSNRTDRILIDTTELQEQLGCGRGSAVKLGMEAEARVEIGRRVLWNRQKIAEYTYKISF